MENWDEATLNDVINKKHGESEKSKPKTAIVSYVPFISFICLLPYLLHLLDKGFCNVQFDIG